MSSFYIIFFVFIFATEKAVSKSSLSTENSIGWNYLQQTKWPAKQCLGGKRQSPINIQIPNTKLMKTAPLNFNEKFGEKLKANIRNEDYTVVVYLNDLSTKADISNGGLNGTYRFLRFNFHWPSQHRINNRRFPLEIVLVFYAAKYGKPEAAIPHKDGFVALSSFYDISEKSNPIFNNLLRSIPEISSKMNNGSVPLKEKIVLNDFIPKNYQRYFRYFGSYSKPICDEIVTCLVFQGPSYISESQYYALINIEDTMDHPVHFNNRNVQHRNGRKIFRSA